MAVQRLVRDDEQMWSAAEHGCQFECADQRVLRALVRVRRGTVLQATTHQRQDFAVVGYTRPLHGVADRVQRRQATECGTQRRERRQREAFDESFGPPRVACRLDPPRTQAPNPPRR